MTATAIHHDPQRVRTAATAYRIWAYASVREWNCTVLEIAEALEVPMATVRMICRWRGWSNRLRSSSKDLGMIRLVALDAEISNQGMRSFVLEFTGADQPELF